MMDNLEEGVKPPSTYQRGSKTIDTILCTGGVIVKKAGYMPFGEGIGDHRALFIDVTVASTLGVDLPPIQSVKARRLKLGDPRVIKLYHKWLRKYFK